MGNIKKNSRRYQGIKKYNRIVSYLVKDRKKKKQEYTLSEIRKLASSIYPNFKQTQYSKIGKKAVVSAEPFTKSIILKPTETLPTFPSELSDPDERYYWGIVDMLTQIQNSILKDDNVFFNSDLAGQENLYIQGGVKIEPDINAFYGTNFKNFVNFLDKQRKEDKIDLGSGSELRVLCLKPIKDNGKWISTIVLTDSEGNPELSEEVKEVLSEYDPNEKYQGTTKPKETPQQKATTKLSASDQIELEKIRANENFNIERIKSEERVKIAQTEVELFRLKKIDEYYKDAISGKITWERYDKLVETLYRK